MTAAPLALSLRTVLVQNPWNEDNVVKAEWGVSDAAIAAMGVATDIGGRWVV